MSETESFRTIENPRPRRRARDTGIALVHVIVIGAALFGLATAALVASRTDQMVSNNVVNGTKAFWIAAAGLDVAKAGAVRTKGACLATNDCAPPPDPNVLDGSYTVTISRYDAATPDPRWRIRSVGTGPNNARKVVEEIVLAPFVDGNEGLIQIDGDRFPTRFSDPRFGAPGWRIPDWTIDGRNHDPVTFAPDAVCPPAPPLGGPSDAARTAVENELDDLRCRIVERANQCCLPGGETVGPETCYLLAGFCGPGICEDPGGSCFEGICDLESCYPGSCTGETCVPATCPIAGTCQRGSCDPLDSSCASGSCVVNPGSCGVGTCSNETCTPGTCAVGSCALGSCAPDDPTCVSGTCNTKSSKCSPGGSCAGKSHCEPATCAVDTASCAPGTCSGDSCTTGTCDLILPCTPGGCTGETCVSAACPIEPCTQGECADTSCAPGSCTANCRQGTECTSGNCVSGSCGAPECNPVCEADCTPGLYSVYAGPDEVSPTAPHYQTHYWHDLDQTNEVPDRPGSWAVDTPCSENDPQCCKYMNLQDEQLRATGYSPPGANPPLSPSDRGPLVLDTPDRTDPYPINYMGDDERLALARTIDGILDAALNAGVDFCIDRDRINGETLFLGDLDNHAYVMISDPNDSNPKVQALSTSGACAGSSRVNNLTINGGSIVQGAGTLIVPRAIQIRDATFEWKGLVVVLENGRIEARDEACGGIWGGVLLQRDPNPANNERVVLGRNLANAFTCPAHPNNAFSINYSCQALEIVNDNLFQTLSWSEVFDG